MSHLFKSLVWDTMPSNHSPITSRLPPIKEISAHLKLGELSTVTFSVIGSICMHVPMSLRVRTSAPDEWHRFKVGKSD